MLVVTVWHIERFIKLYWGWKEEFEPSDIARWIEEDEDALSFIEESLNHSIVLADHLDISLMLTDDRIITSAQIYSHESGQKQWKITLYKIPETDLPLD